jgi:hypothetical protein
MTRRSRRELERALADLTPEGSPNGGHADTPPEEYREAVRAALAYRYDNHGAVDADPTDARALLAEAVEHVDPPHTTTLRDLLGREEAT